MIAQFCEDNQKNWDKFLPELTMAINTSRHELIGYTPSYLNYGRDLRLPQDPISVINPDEPEPEHASIPAEYVEHLEKLQKARELARVILARAATRQRHYYKLRRRDVQYKIGDTVMRREHTLSSAAAGITAKLAPKYSGPWTIVKKYSPLVYDLRGQQGRRLARIHIKDLKPAHTDV